MKKRDELTAEYIRARLNYNSVTGVFRWVEASSNAVKANSVAGCFDRNGYVNIKVCGVRYLAHRLAWLYVYGKFPNKFIDHIDGDKGNNKIANLREAERCENQWNRGAQKNNKYGLKGVSYRKPWRAQIRVRKRLVIIGYFDTKEEAYDAYQRAAREFHGDWNPRSNPPPSSLAP